MYLYYFCRSYLRLQIGFEYFDLLPKWHTHSSVYYVSDIQTHSTVMR